MPIQSVVGMRRKGKDKQTFLIFRGREAKNLRHLSLPHSSDWGAVAVGGALSIGEQ